MNFYIICNTYIKLNGYLSRLHNAVVARSRLLGTVVSLIGATGTTKCGTISSVNTKNFMSVSYQTYTVSCPATTEKTNTVLLSDNVMEETEDKTHNKLYMNIAEVMIYKALCK